MFPAAMVLPMFNGQPLVSPRPAASASAEIPRVWQCAAHDLHHHHHFVRLRFSRRMPLFNYFEVPRTSWCPWIYARSTPVLLFSRRRWQLVAVLTGSGVGGMVSVALRVLLLALGADTARSGRSPLA